MIDPTPYLLRLGFDAADRTELLAAGPTLDGLRTLHRAHVELVAYETIDFQLREPVPLEPRASVDRIVAGRGGYCFMLNGAFSLLLEAMGYEVRRHRGNVQGRGEPQPTGIGGNHMALTAHGVRDHRGTAGSWLVDVGLGDALYEPLPLRQGEYRQGPFSYRLAPSRAAVGGWRLDHDLTGSFVGMDFTMEPATMADFAATHHQLSTSPDSGFVRTPTVQRRHSCGVDLLRGRTLTAVTASGRDQWLLPNSRSWFAVLVDVFGLRLDALDGAARERIWSAAVAAHRRWAAPGSAQDRQGSNPLPPRRSPGGTE